MIVSYKNKLEHFRSVRNHHIFSILEYVPRSSLALPLKNKLASGDYKLFGRKMGEFTMLLHEFRISIQDIILNVPVEINITVI